MVGAATLYIYMSADVDNISNSGMNGRAAELFNTFLDVPIVASFLNSVQLFLFNLSDGTRFFMFDVATCATTCAVFV